MHEPQHSAAGIPVCVAASGFFFVNNVSLPYGCLVAASLQQAGCIKALSSLPKMTQA